MLKLSDLLAKFATGRTILVLLALEILFPAVFLPISLAPLQSVPGAAGIIDFLFFYTPSTVSSMIASYGDTGRAAYLTFLLVTDILHPIVYALLFSLAISWLFRRGFPAESQWQQLNLLPLGSLLFDLLENLSIATMLASYPNPIEPLAWLATGFTMAKWTLTAGGFVLVLIGTVLAIRRRSSRA